jgi:hypothetical protein
MTNFSKDNLIFVHSIRYIPMFLRWRYLLLWLLYIAVHGSVAWGQNDTDFGWSNESLTPQFLLADTPEMDAVWAHWIPQKKEIIYHWSDFKKVTAQDFWIAVDMADALSKKNQVQGNAKSQKQWAKNMRWLPGNKKSASGLSLKISGQETPNLYGTYATPINGQMRMFDPCPPFGVCARCAPYKLGRPQN